MADGFEGAAGVRYRRHGRCGHRQHPWTDYTAQVDVKIENLGTRASASVGLLFRYQDPNNYYAASYDVAARKLTLLKRVGGIVTELAVKEDVELVPGRWHTVKAEAAGRVLRVYVDGQLILAARDGSLSGGGIGFVQIDADVHYDRVRVDLPATPAPMTLPVAEDFEDGVADGWRVIDGNWRVVDDGRTPAYYAPVSDALARTVGRCELESLHDRGEVEDRRLGRHGRRCARCTSSTRPSTH